tara:strand:+ start:986 stop:1111 length:126 start_codon:yes stop_codon:yes gene_type:complete
MEKKNNLKFSFSKAALLFFYKFTFSTIFRTITCSLKRKYNY